MTVKIGAKIKALRKAADVTQEHMSEYLGVTAQAISRWESENCYPDIEMLPAIADFFSVSLDELLGVNQKLKDSKIAAYIEKAEKEMSEGNFVNAIAVYREAVGQFPSSRRLWVNLAQVIGCIDNGEKISVGTANEAVGICQRVLEDCVDDEIRYHALLIQCWVYFRQLNNFEKAMDIVAKLPKIYGCQEFVMAETLKIRMPNEAADDILYAITSAMLITFNRQDVAYSNDKKMRLEALIAELTALLSQVSDGESACPSNAVRRERLS